MKYQKPHIHESIIWINISEIFSCPNINVELEALTFFHVQPKIIHNIENILAFLSKQAFSRSLYTNERN